MVNIEKWVKDGWNLYKNNLVNFLSIYAIYLLAALLLQKVPILPIIIMPSLFGSLVIITLNKIRNIEEIDIKNILTGFTYFLPLMLSSIVIGILVLFGLMLLVLPGLIVSALYIYTIPLIVDQKLDFWQAMETSRKKVMEDAFGFIIFGILLMAMIISGAMFLGVGLMVTMPIAVNTLTYAYIDIFSGEKTITIK
ncbi:hypothetical protein ACFL4D_01935 [Candidatus Margulisiibacteriota bacterium]